LDVSLENILLLHGGTRELVNICVFRQVFLSLIKRNRERRKWGIHSLFFCPTQSVPGLSS
jgi:hypothetical protein